MKQSYILLCMGIAFMQFPSLYATVQWSGPSMTDVTNEDVEIIGPCQLASAQNVTIAATAADVTVYVKKDALISAHPDDLGNSITFDVTAPYTITIKIDHDLTFIGALSFLDQPLQIKMRGSGDVVWDINEDDGSVRFTAQNNSGGTQLWTVISETEAGTVAPEVSFVFTKKNQIFVGPRSSIGYEQEGGFEGTNKAEIVIKKKNSDDDHETRFGFQDVSAFALELYNPF